MSTLASRSARLITAGVLGVLAILVALAGQDRHLAAAEGTRVIAAYGDTGVSSRAATIARQAAEAGSRGYLGLGDYDYGGGAGAWKSQMQPLIGNGCLCVVGNHDSRAAYVGIFPGGRSPWSISVAGVRVIGLDTNQSVSVGSSQWQWLVDQLTASSEPITIVTMHKPWWLTAGAIHPGSGFPGSPQAMEKLMTEHRVSLVLAGHEHNYQRSIRNGVTYAVVGTGGHSRYPLEGLGAGTVATYYGFGHLLLTLSETRITARFTSLAGSQEDAFTIGTSASGQPASRTIYGDMLHAPWEYWPWNSRVDFGVTSPVYWGTRALSFTAVADQGALYLHTDVAVNTAPYTHLHFAARASRPDQRYAVQLRDANDQPLTPYLPLADLGGDPPAGAWRAYSIPLATLNAVAKPIKGIMIQSRAAPLPALYVDGIMLYNGAGSNLPSAADTEE